MKRISVYLCLAAVMLSSCDSSLGVDGRRRVDRPFELVVALLTPDEWREQPTEIFIGRIRPNGEVNPQWPPIGADSEINRQIFGLRFRYRADISGNSDARAWVRTQNGEKVELRHVGNGFYRDVENQLRVEYGQRYELEIYNGGRTYTGQTTVPGKFETTNIRNGDLVRAMRFREPNDPTDGYYRITEMWSQSERVKFYRQISQSSNSNEYRGYEMHNDDQTGYRAVFFNGDRIFPPTDTVLARLDLIAADENFARFYEMGGSKPNEVFWYTFSTLTKPTWGDYYWEQSDHTQFQDRSSITSGGDVAGVFGSYAQFKLRYRIVRGQP